MTFREAFIDPVIAMFRLLDSLFKISPILMPIFSIWVLGFAWCTFTNKRGFLLSLVWFIPNKFLNSEGKRK